MFLLLLYSLDVFRHVPVFQEYMWLMTNSRFTLTYEEITLTEKKIKTLWKTNMIMFRGLYFKVAFNRAKPFDTKVKQLSRNPSWNPFYSYSYPDIIFSILICLVTQKQKENVPFTFSSGNFTFKSTQWIAFLTGCVRFKLRGVRSN